MIICVKAKWTPSLRETGKAQLSLLYDFGYFTRGSSWLFLESKPLTWKKQEISEDFLEADR